MQTLLSLIIANNTDDWPLIAALYESTEWTDNEWEQIYKSITNSVHWLNFYRDYC